MNFDIIATIDLTGKSGLQYTLPLNYCPIYQRCTAIQPVTAIIMGRVTWELLGSTRQSLEYTEKHPYHINVIITSKTSGITISGAKTDSPTVFVGSLQAALNWCLQAKLRNEFGLIQCMVIGGNKLFQSALLHPLLRYGYMTIISNNIDSTADNTTSKFPISLLQDIKYTITDSNSCVTSAATANTTASAATANTTAGAATANTTAGANNNLYTQYRLYDFTK